MLPPRLLRDLLGEARVDAVHVLEADGVPTSQDGVAEGAQRVDFEQKPGVRFFLEISFLGRLHLFRAVTRV